MTVDSHSCPRVLDTDTCDPEVREAEYRFRGPVRVIITG